MAPETRNFARQKGASEGEPSNAPATNQPEGQVQFTANMGNSATLPNESLESIEQLRERIRQLESTLNDALALNRRFSVAMGSASRREDADPANRQSPDETDQTTSQPIISMLTAPQERPLATAQTSVDLSNTPRVDNMFSNVAGSMSRVSPMMTLPSEPSWTQHYLATQPSRTEHSPLPHSAWLPQPPYYQPPSRTHGTTLHTPNHQFLWHFPHQSPPRCPSQRRRR